MRTATALFSDGLDLIAQFLACSRPVDDGIAASFGSLAELRAAAAALEQWSDGASGEGAIAMSEPAMRITVSHALWNTLYARALSVGRPVTPDRIGLSSRGAGGMLAELNIVLKQLSLSRRSMRDHPALADDPSQPGWAEQPGWPWVLMPWEPMKALLLRDQMLAPEAEVARQLLKALPQANELDHVSQRHGVLLQLPGHDEVVLACPRDWCGRMLHELRSHFRQSVLLLFRLMFFSADQGWGWEADSAQCTGLVALMDNAASLGLVDFGEFRDSCVALERAITGAEPGHATVMQGLMAAALEDLVALWPDEHLRQDHPARALFAGWMTQVAPGAQVAPDVVLEPGARILEGCAAQSGVVVGAGATLGPFVKLPPGVMVAAGATVSRLDLYGVVLPPGTVLQGNATIQHGASIQQQVVLGRNVKIWPGVTIPDGVQVDADAEVYELELGAGVRLPMGTRIEGSLRIDSHARIGNDVRFGDWVCIGDSAVIGDGVHLPGGIVVAPRACVGRCLIDRSSLVPAGTVIRGDLVVEANVVIGVGVVFGAGAAIGQGVVLPDGIVVEPGARIDMLKLHGCTLPPGTRVGGNLWLGAHCLIGRGIRFGGDNRIGPWLDLPDHLHIARGAQIRRLMLNNVRLPPGTVVSGDICLSAGVKIGRGVTFKAAVTVINGATIPDGVTVGGGAVVRRCDVQGAQLGPEVWIRGDLRLKPGVQVGAGVEFDDGVVIHCICNIPDGMVFVHGAQVRHFHIAPGVFVPGGTRVAGNLRLGSGVSMAPKVFFNADVLIGEDLHIPAGVRIGRHARIKRLDIAGDVLLPRRFTLHGDVSIGPGARIGCGAKLGADVEIGPGVVLPPNVALDSGARLRRLSIADGVTLPSGTRLGGDLVLRRGVQVGRDVAFGPGVDIGPHVVLPDGASVAAGVRLRELRVATDVELPLDTRIEGNLVLCAGVKVKEGACFGADVRVEADCRIGRGVRIPAGMVVEEGTDVSFLDIAADVSLPCGTHINGNLRIGPGVRVGTGICFGSNVEIGPGVQLPDGAIVIANACIERLAIAGDAVTGEALILCGNAVIEAGARLEDDVLLGADVIVGAGVHLPAGAVLANHARVRALRLGSDIELPAHFVLSGDLCLGDRVVVGGGVRFGAGVVVGAGAVIGEEAVLEDGAVVEAGAQVPPHARIAAPAPPVKLPGTDQETVDKPATASGLPVSPAMAPQPLIPPGDAPFPAWQAYLSAQAPAPTPTTGVEQHDDSQAGTPAQSPPVAIPATYRQPLSRAFHALPWRPPG